ncbi:MAG: hypothetical protein ACYCZF_17910 [Anaerolineae bacterium]
MHSESQFSERIRRVGPILGVVFTALAMVWFNLLPDTVGFYVTIADTTSFTPVLAPAFQTYLPWLNFWWGASILLNLVHIVNGRWTIVTRVADVLLSLYGISLLIGMVTGPAFILLPWLSIVVKVILGISAFGLTVSLIVQVIRVLKAVVAGGKPE